mmetsp:Transcript_12142/g.15729  ORF Transcript_12142/g.15729 Transcript_12142/m.15729 type:complete len:203 (-) Transcript_12142:159-767(-)
MGKKKFGLISSTDSNYTRAVSHLDGPSSIVIHTEGGGWKSGLGAFPAYVPAQLSPIVSPDEWLTVIDELNKTLSKVPGTSKYMFRLCFLFVLFLTALVFLPNYTTGYAALSICLLCSLLITVIIILRLIQVKMEMSRHCNEFTRKFWSRGLVFSYNISICEKNQSWVLIVEMLNTFDDNGDSIQTTHRDLELSELTHKEMFI